jgi:hypothetical protein
VIQAAAQTFQSAKNTPAVGKNAVKSSVPSAETIKSDNTARIASIPNLEQYESLIQRFLSGESALEEPGTGKALTEDQIALRQLMRIYRSTDTRTPSQMQADMQRANQNFNSYWAANGNGAPRPARTIAPDGSFEIVNSIAERNASMNKQMMGLLQEMMSVIKAAKGESYEITDTVELSGGNDPLAAYRAPTDRPMNEAELQRRLEMRKIVDNFEESSIAGQHINPDEMARQEERSARFGAIRDKLLNGQKLSGSEKSFLQENYPELYAQAMQVEQEIAQFRSQLNRASSKEEANRIYMEKKMQALSMGSKNGMIMIMSPALDAAYRSFSG